MGGGVPEGFLEEVLSWVLKTECDFTIYEKGILAVKTTQSCTVLGLRKLYVLSIEYGELIN